MAARYEISSERGVSESIGFLLISAIIITGIALVTLYGYPLLLQQQVSADEKIMEKNMIVLQNDIKSLAYKTVPYKETSLKIGGGSLTVHGAGSNPTTLKIDYDSSPIGIDNKEYDLGELRYESVSAQTDISLQNGAVVMRPRIQQGSTMLAEPRWFIDTQTTASGLKKTMVISIIKITSDTIMAKEGIGTVRMKLVGDPVSTSYGPGTLTVEYIGQDYSVAWENYFTNTLKMSGTGPSYTLPLNKLVIKEYEIKIEGI
jgi:hypothetical protein